METLNLNKIPGGSNPVVHCSQYDIGRVFRFNLFEGSSVYTLDGTETIECNVRKLDGNIVTVGVTNTSSNYIDVVTTEQMTAIHGSNYGEIVFKKNGDVIGTVNFILQVEKSPLEGGITSDSAIYNLETQVVDIVSEQYDSANVIFDSVPTSGHNTPYTVTSDGIKTMGDNITSLIPTNLDDLSDVDISTPSSGEAVVWDGTKWVNGTVSTVGDLDDLSDVDTTGKQNGDSLRYDTNSSSWKAKPTTVEMTKAEYDAIVDFTPYENTHIVITDAPNLNATASDIEYSSGVSVADKLTSLASDKADKTENVTFTPASGVTVIGSSCGKVDKCVNLAMKIEATLTANTEKQLGTISNPPTDECVIPAVSSGAVFLGMVIIKANGNVSIYPTTGGTNLRTCFSVAYKTT